MIIYSSLDENYPRNDAERLYNENKKYFPLFDLTYQELEQKLKGHLWAITVNNELYGVIYFEFKDNKWFLSGFSKRKVYKYVVEAIHRLCTHYFNLYNIHTIYSETTFRHAEIALKRAGFKKGNEIWAVKNQKYQLIKAE